MCVCGCVYIKTVSISSFSANTNLLIRSKIFQEPSLRYERGSGETFLLLPLKDDDATLLLFKQEKNKLLAYKKMRLWLSDRSVKEYFQKPFKDIIR